ncbi:carbonic anhydrase-related protein 10-like protein, partial [Leptotrombidium deliense]
MCETKAILVDNILRNAIVFVIPGPDFWGLLNPEWQLCKKGRRQSPIDIKPGLLLYDPYLRPLHVDKHRVNGILENNGHSIVMHVTEESEQKPEENDIISATNDITVPKAPLSINISGGPLSYSYTFHSIHMHFGRTDSAGSEHHIAKSPFPAELQIIGYNSDLYQNMSEAAHRSNGLVAIALLMQLGNSSNMELRLLTSLVYNIRHRGQTVAVKSLSLRELIPDFDYYMTYEGSMTIPGCHETVTWIIINKPIFITRQQLYALRKLMQGESDSPKAPLGNNYRPLQPLNHRFVRTNIDFKRKKETDCPTMKRNMHYQ